jgi:hypothetical protein
VPIPPGPAEPGCGVRARFDGQDRVEVDHSCGLQRCGRGL